jgi:hypothetical protein
MRMSHVHRICQVRTSDIGNMILLAAGGLIAAVRHEGIFFPIHVLKRYVASLENWLPT